ncbi:MAG: L-threonylcarbamoyladenylate synthase [Pseudomonadota bacterium]
MTKFIKLDQDNPDQTGIEEAVEFLRNGDVIAYPTETIYGLGADLFSKRAVKRIYDLKARDYGLPVSVLVSGLEMLSEIVVSIPDSAFPLIHKFWPGSLTIIFNANPKIPKNLVTNTGKIGVRFSSHPISQALVSTFGRPITTTSANLTDFPPSLSVKHVKKYFGEKLPCIVDGGECYPSKGSTVVDVALDTMRVIRDGAIPAEEVISCFREGK